MERPLPSVEERKEYLEGQKKAILASNFRNMVAKELNERRLASVKDKEERRAIEDELEKMEVTEEGNNEYLELIDKFLGELNS